MPVFGSKLAIFYLHTSMSCCRLRSKNNLGQSKARLVFLHRGILFANHHRFNHLSDQHPKFPINLTKVPINTSQPTPRKKENLVTFSFQLPSRRLVEGTRPARRQANVCIEPRAFRQTSSFPRQKSNHKRLFCFKQIKATAQLSAPDKAVSLSTFQRRQREQED